MKNVLSDSWRVLARHTRAVATIGSVFAAAVALRADAIYTYELDTNSLTGPGTIYFDFTDGDGVINNSVLVSAFSGAVMDTSTVSLFDTGYETASRAITSFGSILTFSVQITTAFDPAGFFDNFAFFLEDANGWVATSAPFDSDALATIDLDGSAEGIAVAYLGSLTPASAAVPDTGSTLVLTGLAFFGLAGAARRLRQQA